MRPAAKVSVDVGVDVSEESAYRAMKLLEWYCNDHDMHIVHSNRDDGTVELKLRENRKESSTNYRDSLGLSW